MKVARTLLWAVAVVALVVAAAMWWVYSSRDALVKEAIERYGPLLTGVPVKVAAVNLEPFEGRGAIKGLELGNPSGYNAPRSMMLGEMRLAVEPASFGSSVVRITELSLEAPSITYERGPGGDNLSAIQRHIEAQLPKSSSAAKSEHRSEAAPDRCFIIDRLQVRKARVSYGGTVDVDVPDIVLRDLGKRSGGASAAQITEEVWSELTRQAIAAAPGALRGLEEKAKSVLDGVKGLFKK